MKDKWENLGKKLAVLGGILALISTLFGGFFWLDSRYASSSELNKVKQRLEYKIVADQQKSIQERIWKIEDRFQGKPMPPDVNDEHRKLGEENIRLKNKLTEMEKQGVQ
jgi:hypothetical protein